MGRQILRGNPHKLFECTDEIRLHTLEGLVEFLRIDPDLVRVAASGSRPAAAPMKPRDVSAWLAKLPGGRDRDGIDPDRFVEDRGRFSFVEDWRRWRTTFT